MFFVLSGYVLAKPYLPAAGSPSCRRIFLPTFYTRRFTRIWL
jgi:peptidoglycan/LPS O-acetylase OafA/YrhL